MQTDNTEMADAARYAEDVLTELFNARIAADIYVDKAHKDAKANKDEYARRFIDHMYLLEEAAEALDKKLFAAGQTFRAVASVTDAPSIHDKLTRVALDARICAVDAMLREAMPDTWPPRERGIYEVPTQLPCKSEFRRHFDTAIAAFVKAGPTLDALNELSNAQSQELARAKVLVTRGDTDAAWPRQAQVATTLGIERYVVQRLVASGALRTNGRSGHKCRVDPASILEYCAAEGIAYNDT